MLDAGDIDEAQYEGVRPAQAEAGQIYTKIREPYFFSYVREQLIAKYGANTVRGGGLKVYTTIDPGSRSSRSQAIRDATTRTDPASALVPSTQRRRDPGDDRCDPGQEERQFNLAAQGRRRQAGSSFKTFVLTEAIARASTRTRRCTSRAVPLAAGSPQRSEAGTSGRLRQQLLRAGRSHRHAARTTPSTRG